MAAAAEASALASWQSTVFGLAATTTGYDTPPRSAGSHVSMQRRAYSPVPAEGRPRLQSPPQCTPLYEAGVAGRASRRTSSNRLSDRSSAILSSGTGRRQQRRQQQGDGVPRAQRLRTPELDAMQSALHGSLFQRLRQNFRAGLVGAEQAINSGGRPRRRKKRKKQRRVAKHSLGVGTRSREAPTDKRNSYGDPDTNVTFISAANERRERQGMKILRALNADVVTPEHETQSRSDVDVASDETGSTAATDEDGDVIFDHSANAATRIKQSLLEHQKQLLNLTVGVLSSLEHTPVPFGLDQGPEHRGASRQGFPSMTPESQKGHYPLLLVEEEAGGGGGGGGGREGEDHVIMAIPPTAGVYSSLSSSLSPPPSRPVRSGSAVSSLFGAPGSTQSMAHDSVALDRQRRWMAQQEQQDSYVAFVQEKRKAISRDQEALMAATRQAERQAYARSQQIKADGNVLDPNFSHRLLPLTQPERFWNVHSCSHEQKWSAVEIQRLVRGHLARLFMQDFRRRVKLAAQAKANADATVIQALVRGFLNR